MTDVQQSLDGMDLKDQGVRDLAAVAGALTAQLPTAAPNMVMESSGLDATRDARAIVRLFQCSMCSRPLQRPASLPCGNTVCFTCLPQLHERQNISYPNTPDRQLGLLCPFEQCGIEHATGDFNVDFTLKRVLDTVGSELQRFMPFDDDTSVVMEESIDRFHDSDRYSPKSAVLPGGRLAATYSLAATGSLPYDMELSYRSASGEDVSHMDKAILCHLREKVRPELQCLVCYTLYLDPITTSCGHTFCRKCLERVLDHSQSCPICRKVQHVSTTFLQFQPSNRQLTDLLIGLFPDDLAQRAALASAEDKVGASELSLPTPLFVCTLSFPKMPTFLHIFEPRYRLMIRRAWQGDRRFGMVLPNRTGESQGELGDDCTFLQFGTLLEIKSYQLLPDGRSWIETVGISRFRVKRWGYRDDYIVSDVETVDDLPISEEETMEALETSTSTSYSTPPSETWGSLSTQQLLEIAQGFVNRMQSTSAPWLHQRVINIYGPPPQDASTFPYWLASVLPITEPEKYRLLSCSSVRERLKIIVGWIKRIEDQQWSFMPWIDEYSLFIRLHWVVTMLSLFVITVAWAFNRFSANSNQCAIA